MTAPSYTKTIDVQAPPSAAYDAVTQGVAHWWTRPDQPLVNIGDRAKFTFPPGVSYWSFELTSTVQPTHVEWTCVDALHIHEGQPKEIETDWLNTKVHWKITEQESGSIIEMQHQGLTPELLCYDVCEAGWDMFFLGSLKQYLDTGKGTPHQG
ncbi:SRPBCC domain-containing protein [Ruegeria sp. 2205SS24-7]|uniref:SRPBCC family protein n=1 Tax=Ruegeria discodermiae TaxID=3064389 RepID=UPI0027424B0A|nr:SRPBCC domain-containing protein [Ruegeria sp. 2205SS24-7]MDP5220597.1 SRPBCC domain-containing protein [Ruegeria sp. 2205SS24-7]